uniref:FLN-1 n=1 Tax=Caenorhabditis japonica TaxID=281687 RepID=A0A8R1HYY1_CAEJA
MFSLDHVFVRRLTSLNGKLYNIPLKINADGTYSTDTPLLQPGKHDLKLFFDELPVKEATVEVKKGTDVSKCRASGPGLEEAVVGEQAKFELDLDGAGEGAVSMEMRGPAKTESRIQDHGNGKCSVEYVANVPGEYEMVIKFGKDDQKEHVKGSPFKASVDYKKDPAQITVTGLDNPNCRVNQPVNFVIDASKTKDLPVTVRVPPDRLPFAQVAENAPTDLTYLHPSEGSKKKKAPHPSICVVAARPDAVRLEHIQEIVDQGHRVADKILFTPTKLGVNALDVYYGGEHVDHVEYEVS